MDTYCLCTICVYVDIFFKCLSLDRLLVFIFLEHQKLIIDFKYTSVKNRSFVGFFLLHIQRFIVSQWIIFYFIWLKYCRYGVKHYPINQSISLSLSSTEIKSSYRSKCVVLYRYSKQGFLYEGKMFYLFKFFKDFLGTGCREGGTTHNKYKKLYLF